jgi:hypothetical protein
MMASSLVRFPISTPRNAEIGRFSLILFYASAKVTSKLVPEGLDRPRRAAATVW